MITGASFVAPAVGLVVAFLLGSIPFGVLISKIFSGKNIQKEGSGNIGATNVSRIYGFWPAGFLVFLFDFLKGVLAVFLMQETGARLWAEPWTGGTAAFPETVVWTAGFLAVLGHCFSPWLRFYGGKGVATGFGVALMLAPGSALIGLLAFVLVFFSQRIGSLASLSGLMLAAVSYVVWNEAGAHLWAGAAIVFLIVIRHESNIDALLEDRERSFQ